MKKTLLIGGLAALTLAAGGGVAFAQSAPGAERLSRAEFVNQRVQRLTAADANGDGMVTADEMRAAAQTRMAARADARFDRLDANDDGAISRAELAAAREARADRPRGARADRRAGRMGRPARAARMEARGPVVIAEAAARAEQAFVRLDVDNDGYVTAAERQSARQAMREQRRERMTARRAERQASPQAPASE
jgi:Ca2+-binding EF-hand superfamily protein